MKKGVIIFLTAIITLIISIGGCLFIYKKYLSNDCTNMEGNIENGKNTEEGVENSKVTNNYVNFDFYYISYDETDSSGKKTESSIVLRNDGDFYLNVVKEAANAIVGTYMLDENDITFYETVTYGSGACFYYKDSIFYGKINEDNSLEIIRGNKKYLFTSTTEKENEESKNFHIKNPVNGHKQLNSPIELYDCTHGQ